MMFRVQEYIERSRRYHLFQPACSTIAGAFALLRVKARAAQLNYRTYDYSTNPETFIDHAHMETDQKTYITVISDGGARRRFTIVTKRKSEPVPFDTLNRIHEYLPAHNYTIVS